MNTLLLRTTLACTAAYLVTAVTRADDRDNAVQLERFEVQGLRSDANYKADHTDIGTRTDSLLIDVPQSISVVTQEQIRDQQMSSLGDVVQYVPGVQSHQGENNRDQLIIRGQSSSADFFVNGVRDDVQYYRDLYNLERVEVLRGPNAMIFGRGGGGGVVNRTTKAAGFTPLREGVAAVGAFDYRRAALDFNQPFNAKTAARINAFAEDSGSFRDHVSLRRYGISPTLTVAPSDRTKVTASYEYLHDRRTADRGITSFQGAPADVPIETFYGNPDDSRVRADVHLFSVSLEHRMGALTLRNRTQYADYDRGYQNYVPGAVNATKTLVTLTAYNNATQRQNVFTQTDLIYSPAGALKQTILGGFELGEQQTDNFRRTGYFNNATTSMQVPFDHPQTQVPVVFRQSATDADNHLRTTVGAVYVQDQVEFTERLQAVLGVRYDAFTLRYHNNRNGDDLKRRDDLISPRVGLVYKARRLLSAYASYSVSYLPSSGDQFASLTTVTQQVKPENFANYEFGTKWDLRRDWFFTTAAYQLDRTNTRATDPNDATRIVQTGAQRTRGLEFAITGAIRRNWTVSAGYALQDAVIRSATTAARAGARVPQVPRHNFSFWNKYQVTPKLALGVGVLSRSGVYAAIDNTVKIPGFTRIDAAAYYTLNEHWRVQANVENLLDRKYYLNADSNTNISPGSPIALRVALTAKF